MTRRVARAPAGCWLGHPNWLGYAHLARAGVLVCGGAFALAALRSDWLAAGLWAGFGAAAGAMLRYAGRLPALLRLLLIAAALLNAAGYAGHLYDRLALFDKIVHGYTLFALTLPLGVLATGALLTRRREQRIWLILIIASFGIAIGALWEIAEWAFDLLVPTNVIQGKTDTITDLIVDSLGAILAARMSLWVIDAQVAGGGRNATGPGARRAPGGTGHVPSEAAHDNID